ncbi:hypothetical protein [Streptomyces sp. NPDC007100]|uniref:hypothetical protein n=1 Tax=Streptomyces sp. NPDC007100 TaxID=3155602 RepID=UPI0033E52CDE
MNLRIGWGHFEKLCPAVSRDALGLRGVNFQRYGVPGQAQHGIDLSRRRPDGKYTVIQCKEYQEAGLPAADRPQVGARPHRPDMDLATPTVGPAATPAAPPIRLTDAPWKGLRPDRDCTLQLMSAEPDLEPQRAAVVQMDAYRPTPKQVPAKQPEPPEDANPFLALL